MLEVQLIRNRNGMFISTNDAVVSEIIVSQYSAPTKINRVMKGIYPKNFHYKYTYFFWESIWY